MELLVAVVDHGPDVDHIKKGEVITIQEDGWGWTEAELNNPNWRIIRSPIINTHAQSLMIYHTDPKQVGVGQRFPRKRNLLNVDALGSLPQGQIIEKSRGELMSANKRVD
jgi:hypothetical protein